MMKKKKKISKSRRKEIIEQLNISFKKIDFNKLFNRQADSVREVYCYSLSVAKKSEKIQINLSVREISENTGISITTVSRSLGALQKRNFLECIEKSWKFESAKFKLIGKIKKDYLLDYSQEFPSYALISYLGRNGAIVYSELKKVGKKNKNDLMKECEYQMSTKTFYRQLKKLESEEILSINNNDITLLKDVDTIADENMEKKCKDLKIRYKREREFFRFPQIRKMEKYLLEGQSDT
ncbi:MAG: winged helix-turn-helix transcriptional regulator [Leptospiraceae bacterium]|nr:winged helix-turn-helix transcriptional regulator [Leptospiraceae bacterium]